jgi:hypothetical protein
MSKEEMSSCKKCGSDDVQIHCGIGYSYFGYCNNCAYEPMKTFSTIDEAIGFWNTLTPRKTSIELAKEFINNLNKPSPDLLCESALSTRIGAKLANAVLEDQELIELRAWKEKARPLLNDFSTMISKHVYKDYYKRRMEILTELIKEGTK